jgi:hypothetical protein
MNDGEAYETWRARMDRLQARNGRRYTTRAMNLGMLTGALSRGEITDPPSTDGPAPSDGPRQLQLNLDETDACA